MGQSVRLVQVWEIDGKTIVSFKFHKVYFKVESYFCFESFCFECFGLYEGHVCESTKSCKIVKESP